jgi:predicted RNA-binding protein with PUA-like domain
LGRRQRRDDRAAAAGYYDVKSAAENAEWQMKQRAKVSDTEGSTWLRRERKTDLQMAPIVKAAEKQLPRLIRRALLKE